MHSSCPSSWRCAEGLQVQHLVQLPSLSVASPGRAIDGQHSVSGNQSCSPKLLPHWVRALQRPATSKLSSCNMHGQAILMTANAKQHAPQDGFLSRCQGHCRNVLHMGSCGCVCCRSSLATPRILTPAGARRADVWLSDEVVWRESVDSTSAAAGRGLPRAAGGPPRGECTGSAAAGGWKLAVFARTGSELG